MKNKIFLCALILFFACTKKKIIIDICDALKNFKCDGPVYISKSVKKYHFKKTIPRPYSDGINSYNEFAIYSFDKKERSNGLNVLKVKKALPPDEVKNIEFIFTVDNYLFGVVEIEGSGFETQENIKELEDYYSGNDFEVIE